MKAWVVEGNRQHLDGGSMFGNAPKALWSRWMQADDQNRIPLSCRALLIQTNEGKNILFETGIGNFFDPKLKERYGIFEKEHMLIKNLGALGFKPRDIDIIILSHLHFDHAGGLLSSFGEPPEIVFSKALFYVGKEHWERAQQPHIREQASFIPILHQLLKDSGRLKLIERNAHPDLDFGIIFHYSHGHTIGMIVSEIQLNEESIFFVSDLVPGKPWVHLPVTMGYDRFPELLVDEKTQLFDRVLQQKGILFFTHDPETSFATVELDPNGRFKAQEQGLRALACFSKKSA